MISDVDVPNCSLPVQAGHVDKTGHTSKTSSFNDRSDRQDQSALQQGIAAESPDFEAVYNDGLILQEKASMTGGSTQGQLDLLRQVCCSSQTASCACNIHSMLDHESALLLLQGLHAEIPP